MALSKQSRKRLADKGSPMSLAALGVSGPWEIAIDQTVEGPDRWFAQIEGPSAYFLFEIPSLDIIRRAEKFMADAPNKNGNNASPIRRKQTLSLGTSKAMPVNLVRDDEFSDRYFLSIALHPSQGGLVWFTLAGDDLAHIRHALSQVVEDLPE